MKFVTYFKIGGRSEERVLNNVLLKKSLFDKQTLLPWWVIIVPVGEQIAQMSKLLR